MADYKRKKFKKKSVSKHKNTISDNINTYASKKKNGILPENDIKVVRGAKLKQKHRTKIILTSIAVIAIACVVLSFVLPVSLYENAVNLFSAMGTGKYPNQLVGSTVLDTESNGSYYYVLTDTNITAYSNSGKKIFTEMHGFANPVMSVADTRVLVFEQGGDDLYVYNLSGLIDTLKTDNDIINANISRSGYFAVSTHSENYTSVVTVYDKNFNTVFTWNSAKDIINNVLLNSRGNKIAVSSLNSVSGQYVSKLHILNFDSADPLNTVEFNNSAVLSLCNTGNGISVITHDGYKFVDWKKYTTTELTVSGEINMMRTTGKGVLLVYNRANDRSDNTVILISSKGVKTNEFKLNDSITDIQYDNKRIYYVNDVTVNLLDKNGNILRNGDSDYGIKKIVVISSNAVAAVNDSEISKITIESGEV